MVHFHHCFFRVIFTIGTPHNIHTLLLMTTKMNYYMTPNAGNFETLKRRRTSREFAIILKKCMQE